MVYDPALLDAIERLPARGIEQIVWRHMFSEVDPARANTRGARWNPPGVAAIYASRERETALAEADYAIAIQPVRPRAARHIYRIRVTLERVIDLTSRPVLADLGVGNAELTDVGHGPCQAVGGAAHWFECDGLLVPSARADGTNLVIFADRADVDASFEILDREDIPT